MLLWLVDHVSNAQESYYSYTLVITGLTGVLVMFPAVYFYRKDRIGRLIGGLTSIEEQRLSVPEMLLLLGAGAGFAQYANVLVAILQNWISSSYGETMTKITSGKSLFMMVFWMGIVAPVAEEMIFRWLVYLQASGSFFRTGFRCDLCRVFRDLSWKCPAGCVCVYPGSSFCVVSGDGRQ